jgi:beta-phosphoglucomutase-like phosphatase (HAD superfamily)
MSIKAVIFDQDGVIIESESLQSRAYGLVIEEYGKKPIPYENGLIQPFVGTRGSVVWEELKRKYNLDEDIDVLREKRRQAILIPVGIPPTS